MLSNFILKTFFLVVFWALFVLISAEHFWGEGIKLLLPPPVTIKQQLKSWNKILFVKMKVNGPITHIRMCGRNYSIAVYKPIFQIERIVFVNPQWEKIHFYCYLFKSSLLIFIEPNHVIHRGNYHSRHIAKTVTKLLVGGGHVSRQILLGLENLATVEAVMGSTWPLMHHQAILGVESLSTVEALKLEGLAALLLVILCGVIVTSRTRNTCTCSADLLGKALPQSKQSW